MKSRKPDGAIFFYEKQKARLKAKEVVEYAKTLEHLKNKPIKYLLK
jgi:hypothetical protein